MNRKPNFWWFFGSILIAMVVTYIIWLVRFFVGGGLNDVVEMGGYAALIGLLTFPIGSPLFLWIAPPTVSRHFGVISLAGYFIYLLFGIIGWRWRSWYLFLFLCLLLLANIAGCHMNHTTESLPLSP
jgi:hypothetical protein